MNTRVKKVSEKQALIECLSQSEYYKNQYVKMVHESTKILGDYAEAVGLLRQSLDEIIRLTGPYTASEMLDLTTTHETSVLVQIHNLACEVYNKSSIITQKG